MINEQEQKKGVDLLDVDSVQSKKAMGNYHGLFLMLRISLIEERKMKEGGLK